MELSQQDKGVEDKAGADGTGSGDRSHQSDPVVVGLVEVAPCGYKLPNI